MIATYEDRVRKLEEDKLLIRERMANAGRPKSSFENTLRTVLTFLSNPWKLWNSDRLDDKRAVLKLAFADNLRYARGQGFRTADLSLPFKLLDALEKPGTGVARPEGFEPPALRFVV